MPKIKGPGARDLLENMRNMFMFSYNVISYIKLKSLLIYYAI